MVGIECWTDKFNNILLLFTAYLENTNSKEDPSEIQKL